MPAHPVEGVVHTVISAVGALPALGLSATHEAFREGSQPSNGSVLGMHGWVMPVIGSTSFSMRAPTIQWTVPHYSSFKSAKALSVTSVRH